MWCARVSKLSFRLCSIRLFTSANNSTVHEKIRSPILQQLATEYGHDKFLDTLFSENSKLERSSIYSWRNSLNILRKHGFPLQDSFSIVSKCPTILEFPHKRLDDMLTEWMSYCRLSKHLFKFLFINRPELLGIDFQNIRQRIPFLLSYCTSRERLVILLLMSPDVMFEDWEDIIKKINFLNDDMLVHRLEIFDSQVFSKSFRHIKLRFLILQKCGVYKVPKFYEHNQTRKELLKLKNPPLRKIIDTSNASFARKVARITPEEYEVFEIMLVRDENENDSDSESNSDSEE